MQFIKFGLVGAFNTVLNYLIYNLVFYLIVPNVHAANLCGFVISVFSAFLLQSKFVFRQEEGREKRSWWKTLIKTYISYSFTGLFLTEILLFIWIDVIDLSQYLGGLCGWLGGLGLTLEPQELAASVAPVLNMTITIPTNFIINKFWAYRTKKTGSSK